MICELDCKLSMAEIAAISQRALSEQIAGQVGGVFTVLWCKLQKLIEQQNRGSKPRKSS